jgi:hypothetical protein
MFLLCNQAELVATRDNSMGRPLRVEQQIAARIRAGQLPCAHLYEVFGRRGDGLACACCDDPITSRQIEYDVELSCAMGPVTTLPMHGFCYHAWHQVSSAIRCGEHVCLQGSH